MASNLDSLTTTLIPKSLFNIDFSYLGKAKFLRKKSKIDGPDQVNAKIYSLRLNHLFNSSNKNVKNLIKKEFKLKRMRDLIHSLSALYDNCLPDIGPSSIYDCICAPKSYTICILKDDDSNDMDQINESDYDSSDCLSTIEESNPEPSSIFTGIYSDMENEDDDSSSSEEEDEDNDKDFTKGLDTFLKQNSKKKANTPNRISIIKNLIACATIQRTNTYQLPGQDEWIIDLQLMCVRKMYRGFSIGKYILNSLIKNPNYVGLYDAIVTSSDVYATKFYEKYNFNVDHILNSKYANIGDIWTNTTKMCYLPTYSLTLDTDSTKTYLLPFEVLMENKTESDLFCNNSERSDLDDKNDFIFELTNMEKDYKKWQKLMFSSYQYQSQLFMKLKQEIMMLKAKLCAKDGIIDDLRIQNQLLVKNNSFLKLQLDNFLNDDQNDINKQLNDDNDDVHKLIAQLEAFNDKLIE